jgi:hypothetical protein
MGAHAIPVEYTHYKDDYVDEVIEDLKFIKDSLYYLTKDDTVEIVVITHHCPTYNVLDEKYTSIEDTKNINSFFASHLDELFGYNIKAWLCGHTHGSKKITNNHM